MTLLSDRPVDEVVVFVVVPLFSAKAVLVSLACLLGPRSDETAAPARTPLPSNPLQRKIVRAVEYVALFALTDAIMALIAVATYIGYAMVDVRWASNLAAAAILLLSAMFAAAVVVAFLVLLVGAPLVRDLGVVRAAFRRRLAQMDTFLAWIATI